MGRRPCCSKQGMNRGAWTAHEDQLLTRYIQTHGVGKWRNLPNKAGLNRCGKSCRLRWLNYLRPDIKRGNISPDEEDLIIRLHNLLGNRWSLIAGRLPGRTDNEIKNYWNTNLGKRIPSPAVASHPTNLSIGPRTRKLIIPAAAQSVVQTKALKCSNLVYYPRPKLAEEEQHKTIHDERSSSPAALETSSSSCAPANNAFDVVDNNNNGHSNSNDDVNGNYSNSLLQGSELMGVDFEAGADISLSELLLGCDELRDLCDFNLHGGSDTSNIKSEDLLMAVGGGGGPEMLISSEEMLEEGGWNIDVIDQVVVESVDGTAAGSNLEGYEEWVGIGECSTSQ